MTAPAMRRCLICRYQFEPERHWHRFCGSTCRNAAQGRCKSIALAEYVCVYCGQIGDTIDHIPPRTARIKLRNLGIFNEYEYLEVRSCNECNTVLGAIGLWTLRERKRHIKQWLAIRYAHFLQIPEWTPEELLELGRGLQDSVLYGVAVQKRVIRRLKF